MFMGTILISQAELLEKAVNSTAGDLSLAKCRNINKYIKEKTIFHCVKKQHLGFKMVE